MNTKGQKVKKDIAEKNERNRRKNRAKIIEKGLKK